MSDPDLMARLREGAEAIRRAAALFAGWSERIPATGHVDNGFGPDEVRVVFGGPAAPHAITFEAPHAPYWKHPVFARGPRSSWWWVAQIPPRRFLLPAVDAYADEAVHKLAQVVDDWALEFGFHHEA
jgi:hypothetical protein